MRDGKYESPGIFLGDGEGMATRFWKIAQVIVGKDDSL
jgi:hypothetical protein